jgi:hypothetical protein
MVGCVQVDILGRIQLRRERWESRNGESGE